MGNQNDSGVFKLENRNWGYRFTVMRNGQRKDIRRKQDDFGNPFKTKKDATKARQIALQQEQDKSKPKPAGRKTVAELFKEYCEKVALPRLPRPSASRTVYGKIIFARSMASGMLMISMYRILGL